MIDPVDQELDATNVFRPPAFLRGPGADEAFEDPVPPYQEAKEEVRELERELEREASGGHTADESLGSDGKPLTVGDVAVVAFGVGKKTYEKTGTLLALGGGVARVRLNGSKDPLGEVFPHSRVRTEPINGGRPLKSKGEKKTAAQHALYVKEYQDVIADARPSDGFDHAHEAAEEAAPLPKRVLRSHNGGVSDATVFRHIGNIRKKTEVAQEAAGKLRAAWKSAKDDGVDPKVLKQIMAELQLSPDELVDQINTQNSYRAMVHLPNHGPIDSASGEDRDDPAKREAYAKEQGILAGFRGAGADTNPYVGEGDPCHLSWDEGWRDAQSKLLLRGIQEL